MDLRHIVAVDHANMRQLIEELLRSPTATGATGRDNLFDQLDSEVRRHLKLMDKVVMPAMQAEGGATTSRDPQGEHKELKRMLDELDSGDKSSSEWTSRFQAFTDRLDRAFADHTQMVAQIEQRPDARDIAMQYERAKAKAIRSGGYVSRWGGNGRAIAGIGIGLAAAAVAAALWRRRSQSDRGDIIPTQRRLNPPTAYGRTGRTSTAATPQLH